MSCDLLLISIAFTVLILIQSIILYFKVRKLQDGDGDGNNSNSEGQ